jgi:Notch-like protein
MTKVIKISINHKRELCLSSRNSKNPKIKEHYKLLTKVIKEAKILQYKKQISNSYNKTRTIWNVVKSETRKKRGTEEISSLNINGTLIQNQQTIAKSFYDYFLTTTEKLMGATQIDTMSKSKKGAPLLYILCNCKYPHPNIKFGYTSPEELEEIIKSLKTKNAYGYDEISVKILKWSDPFISSPLTYIFNKSLELGFFPSRLQYSTVVPIFKAGDKFNMSNFRPISVLISFSKIF